MELKFRTWLESINRDVVRRIILDAIGGGRVSPEQQSQILGSQVSLHPELMSKLKNYTQLQPMMNQIASFLSTKPNADLISLINYVNTLNGPSMPHPQTDDSRGDIDAGDTSDEIGSSQSPI